ncbi:acyl-CoA carboxylase subunit epsilon [Streptomyces sp. NPDC101393]|uniref:acyl-CoA carboxylase subunit epsilon n=1 Tax=Streptomyces sp. NPDC101393 TaxID=3366141 RepID=UPI0037FF3DA8
MSVDAGDRTLLRVERGQASEEELAAVAVSLFSLLVRREEGPDDDGQRAVARWQRWERAQPYRAPHSWK